VRTSRRQFLGGALVGAASLAGRTAPEPSPLHLRPRAQGATGALSVVGVAIPAAHLNLGAALAAAIRLAGGLSFIRPGETVLLKPAVNSAKPYPATSDPEAVYVLARLVQHAGGRPIVADRTMFLRSTRTAFRKTGILDAAAQARAPCLALDDEEAVEVEHPLAAGWGGRIPLYRAAVEADHLVSLCTPRTHRLGDFTMAMKNLVGVVNGPARVGMHLGSGFKARLAEIPLVARPTLSVMDGRLGFADGGPDEGELCRPGFVAASADPLALDAVGLAFLRLGGAGGRIAGGSIWQLPVMRRAVEVGVGASSAAGIRLAGVDPELEARLRAQMA
jgi:uncharacterized protein (DUF362 family)